MAKQEVVKRRVMGHLSPKYYTLFTGYMQSNEFRKCEAVNEIIQSYFNSIPDKKKDEYLKRGINSNKY